MADGTSVPAAVLTGRIATPARAGGMRRFARHRSTVAVVMCLPLFILLAGLVIYPTIYAIYLSLLNRKMTQFIGLLNYRFLLQRDTFRMVIFQSAFFAISSVILKAFFGLVMAHLMHNIPSRRQRLMRGLLLVPWVMPLALSTLGWWWMFDPSYSSINYILKAIGLPQVAWLGSTWAARSSMVMVNTWFGTAFFMMNYLAALKSVPEQLYEAAAIDGASAWQKLRYITLPMMRNILSITIMFSLIVTFANFDIVRILTNGGPENQTHVFATYAFQVGIQSGNIPLGAAVSLFMLPILAISAFFVLRGVNRRSKDMAA